MNVRDSSLLIPTGKEVLATLGWHSSMVLIHKNLPTLYSLSFLIPEYDSTGTPLFKFIVQTSLGAFLNAGLSTKLFSVKQF